MEGVTRTGSAGSGLRTLPEPGTLAADRALDITTLLDYWQRQAEARAKDLEPGRAATRSYEAP